MFIAPDAAPRRRKGRGKARGHEITAKVEKEGKLTVIFDEAGGTWKVLGDNGLWFDGAVDIHTRDICETFHNAWKDILANHKRDIQEHMLVSRKIYSYQIPFKFNIKKSLTV